MLGLQRDLKNYKEIEGSAVEELITSEKDVRTGKPYEKRTASSFHFLHFCSAALSLTNCYVMFLTGIEWGEDIFFVWRIEGQIRSLDEENEVGFGA